MEPTQSSIPFKADEAKMLLKSIVAAFISLQQGVCIKGPWRGMVEALADNLHTLAMRIRATELDSDSDRVLTELQELSNVLRSGISFGRYVITDLENKR